MTVEYTFSLAQLAQILSALENERRNPNTKRNAIRAIERKAAQIGLSAEDVFDAADGLLSGRLSAAEFRAALRDEGCEPASSVTEAPAKPAPIYTAYEPTTQKALPAPEEDPAQPVDVHIDDLHAIDHPVAKANAQSWPSDERPATIKQQLLAACQATAHWLQAERDRPGETRPDDILRVLRAAITRAEGQSRRPRQAHESRGQRQPRAGSKESQVIAMLRRPEGATLAQIGENTGWQTHTIRGFFAAALKKRHGLAVTSEKPAGGERTYRLAE